MTKSQKRAATATKRQVKTNPNTVQRAYSELEREDLVFTQRGMGTFVAEDENIIIKLKKIQT